jgi:hypothetical protein
MLKFFTQHLDDSKTTYFQHLKFAVYASGLLAYAAITSLIHALFPFAFKGTAAYIVVKLYKGRLENHPNPKYQQWVKNDSHKPRDN